MNRNLLSKLSIKEIASITAVRDVVFIIVGSLIYAFAVDAFAIPEGLAAGGLTGLATITSYIAKELGYTLPVGLQVLAANGILLIIAFRRGGVKYAVKTIGGIIASSVFMDLLAPIVPALGEGDLLLCALWGGVLSGIGLGLVFRTGGNTGGSDIAAQLLAKKVHMSVGTMSIIIDYGIVCASIPVFSLTHALYAMVMTFLMGVVIDYVIDGPRDERIAWIISKNYAKVREEILHTMGRGCTQLNANGGWKLDSRPIIFVILSRREIGLLKQIVAYTDPDAIVVISEAHEAFGEGFKDIEKDLTM